MSNIIRLSDYDLQSIKDLFQKNFPASDHLWIFGSRIYPEKRGGDIDLYIETTLTSIVEIDNAERAFYIQLQDSIGEQKIDIVINNHAVDLPIYKVAKKEGILLV